MPITKHPPLQVGERIGRWQVLSPAGTQNRTKLWHCRCDCGNTKTVASNLLKRARAGHTDGSTQCRHCANGEQQRFQTRAEPPSPPQPLDCVGDWLVLERGIWQAGTCGCAGVGIAAFRLSSQSGHCDGRRRSGLRPSGSFARSVGAGWRRRAAARTDGSCHHSQPQS